MAGLRRIPDSRLWWLFLACCTIILLGSGAGADEKTVKPLAAFAIGSIPDPPALQPEVLGGSPVFYTDWPATYYAQEANCTITLVGPKAALLAAHCLQPGQSILLKKQNGSFVASDACALDSYYPLETPDHDLAICLLNEPVEHSRYESLDFQTLDESTRVYLVGFGCSKVDETGGCCLKWDAGKCVKKQEPGEGECVLREGRTNVEVVVGNPARGDNVFVTQGEAVACLGDSGGGVFRKSGGNTRKIVGIVQSSRIPDFQTFVVATSAQGTRSFLDKWRAEIKDHLQEEVQICGINFPDKTRCR